MELLVSAAVRNKEIVKHLAIGVTEILAGSAQMLFALLKFLVVQITAS